MAKMTHIRNLQKGAWELRFLELGFRCEGDQERSQFRSKSHLLSQNAPRLCRDALVLRAVNIEKNALDCFAVIHSLVALCQPWPALGRSGQSIVNLLR